MEQCDDFDDTEVKSELLRVMDELTSSFEVFKRTNDERLAELERRGSADVLTSDKLARIDSALDAQQKSIDGLIRKASRPMLASTSIDTAAIEHKNAYDVYVRKGETALLSKLESKALSVGSEADGGYLVPAESEMAISRALQTQSPIRAMSSVRRVSSSVYKRPFSTSGANAGWIAETAARAQTGTPGLSELAFPTMELFAMPAATMTLLDDAAVNIDDWLAEEVNGAFAAQESAAFVSGDGNGKPKGFLAYTAVANSSWTWGNMGYVATGVAGGFPASSAADKSSYHSPRQTDLSPARRMPVTSGVVRLWVRLVVRSETAKKTKSATLKNLRFHNKHRSFI